MKIVLVVAYLTTSLFVTFHATCQPNPLRCPEGWYEYSFHPDPNQPYPSATALVLSICTNDYPSVNLIDRKYSVRLWNFGADEFMVRGTIKIILNCTEQKSNFSTWNIKPGENQNMIMLSTNVIDPWNSCKITKDQKYIKGIRVVFDKITNLSEVQRQKQKAEYKQLMIKSEQERKLQEKDAAGAKTRVEKGTIDNVPDKMQSSNGSRSDAEKLNQSNSGIGQNTKAPPTLTPQAGGNAPTPLPNLSGISDIVNSVLSDWSEEKRRRIMAKMNDAKASNESDVKFYTYFQERLCSSGQLKAQ